MKRVRCSQWGGQLRQACSSSSSGTAAAIPRRPFFLHGSVRCQSSVAASVSEAASSDSPSTLPSLNNPARRPLPSPSPERALRSAKLAALHARLCLSKQIPLQTLARALVTSSADPNASFNNQNLADLGSAIINYHVIEYLLCKWPRLPTVILYEALRAYAGPDSLAQVARRWGTEAAAAPGEEVDPGLLQWSPDSGHNDGQLPQEGYPRTDKEYYRRGVSSRVVLDDDFGDTIARAGDGEPTPYDRLHDEAFASFAHAIVGSIYAHCGRQSAKAFVDSHILSRQLDLSSLFAFNLPTRELSMLCAREGFEPPLARLESETGRLSRTPVFVVGIYSGKDKLGEAAGASLDVARRKASMNALKAWYLYSPGHKVRVPSDMFEEDAKPWTAPHIDIGEIL